MFEKADPRDTIRDPRRATSEPRGFMEPLVPADDRWAPGLVLGELLGEGGMGLVRNAVQGGLDRDVAVKQVRHAVPPGAASEHLLREARVTGMLEHPHILPIYGLARDGKGRPLIVMKRVEGRTWEEELRGFDRSDPDQLERHLRVLVQVADAVDFAHSRGIVHRDLKPENVMIGAFREVYVMDWGVAVSVLSHLAPDVPLARDQTMISGTPAYMAPEQASGDGPSISERTDVYLLGAILHEVLTGAPPHPGDSVVESLAHARRSEPYRYGSGVPEGLAAICRRSMSADPKLRHRSARRFREDVEEYLRHRPCVDLVREAAARLDTLREMSSPDRSFDPAAHERVHTLFTECRFAFKEALRIWPENAEARCGLQDAVEIMIDYEICRDSPRSAVALLAELPEPRPALKAAVDAALSRERERKRKLAELERRDDDSVAGRLRGWMALGASASLAFSCVFAGVLRRSGAADVGNVEMGLVFLAHTLGLAVLTALFRKVLLDQDRNRHLVVATLVAMAQYSVLFPTAEVLALPVLDTVAVLLLVATAVWLVAGMVVDRALLPMSFAYVVAFLLAIAWPEHTLEWLGLSTILGVAPVSRTWYHRGLERRQRRPAIPRPA